MRFIRRSAGIQLVPARGFLHEARGARNRPCSPVTLVKLVRADFGGFVRVCCFCRCVCLPGCVSMAAKRCQQASCLGGAVVSGVALLQGENTSKKAKVAKPARPDRSKLSLPTKSRFEPRRGGHELFLQAS